MNLFDLPWMELTVFVPLIGVVCLTLVRDPGAASRWCLLFCGLTFGCALLTWIGEQTGHSPTGSSPWDVTPLLFGYPVLGIDGLSAPLLPLVALLHVLTALTTAPTQAIRLPFAWLLVGESLQLAAFACIDPLTLIVLLIARAGVAYLELRRRGKPARVFAIHMGLFSVLLLAGWAIISGAVPLPVGVGGALMFGAVLVRSGAVPAHLWVADLIEHASFGMAMLFVTPITGAYLAVRLVIPIAPDWVLQSIGIVSLVTACYAAGLAVVQTEARRVFAYLFLSHASLVLVGLELLTPLCVTGALCLWVSVVLSLGGLGLTIRALEARFGRLSLDRFSGLYDQSPALAVCFLLTGLGSVGFPGTLGFVAAEMLADGTIMANPGYGVAMVLAGAVNGIAVVRMYFRLFTGTRHVTSISLGITARERWAVTTLAVLIIGGGQMPGAGAHSRYKAAEALLATREPAPTTRSQIDHPGQAN